MQNTIFSKIQAKYSTFSPTHKKIADYICQNYIEMTYQSISEISKKIGVSTGSITNFCKVMDYKGFQQLHEELRRVAKDEIFPLRDIQDSITSQSLGEGAQLLQQVLDMNISNLQATFTDHLEQNFTIALNQLRKARNIYILGLRSAMRCRIISISCSRTSALPTSIFCHWEPGIFLTRLPVFAGAT